MLGSQIENYKKYHFLLKELIKRDFKIKYKRSILGALWSLLNPIITMLVLNIVFSQLFRFQIPNYTLYLITGLVCFNFLSEATNMAMNSIVGNYSLLNKVYIPKYIFPLSKSISSLINLALSLLAMYIVVLVTNSPIGMSHLLLPVFSIYILFFVMGIGYILAAIIVLFRDIQFLYSLFLMIWMYLTPIMYPIDIIPDNFIAVIYSNPLYYYIDFLRIIIIDNDFPSLQMHLVCGGMSSVSILIGLFTFKKLQDKFVDFM